MTARLHSGYPANRRIETGSAKSCSKWFFTEMYHWNFIFIFYDPLHIPFLKFCSLFIISLKKYEVLGFIKSLYWKFQLKVVFFYSMHFPEYL